MIPVGLARVPASYASLKPPYHPSELYPELMALPGVTRSDGPNNSIYAGFREALFRAGLDAGRFGTREWNPLGELVRPGGRVVLKPNFIRHWNPNDAATVESVITHGTILRAAADYAAIASGPDGSLCIAEAPQMDCDFDRIREIVGLDELREFYNGELNRRLDVIDLRQEAVVFENGIIVERKRLSGDPLGYRIVDLGEHSFFTNSGLDPQRFRGADYDPGPTGEHHQNGKNEYLISETVLSADLVVNLPKIKTHKKTGVTLSLKNLVGINGDKNWLPHHSLGGVEEGGDEFPGNRLIDRLRSRATEIARPLLARGRGLGFFRWVRSVETETRGSAFIRAGNWYGNQTTWRMCMDLNRCLYYSDADGFHPEAKAPVRTVLTVLDGVVAGEDEGPLAPKDRPLGAIIASTDPVAADLAAIRLMGFDEAKIPKVRSAMEDQGLRVTRVRSTEQITVFDERREGISLDDLECSRPFMAHQGWRGKIERNNR